MAVHSSPWRKRHVELYEFEARAVHVIISGQPELYSKNLSQNKYQTKPNPTQQQQQQLQTPKVT